MKMIAFALMTLLASAGATAAGLTDDEVSVCLDFRDMADAATTAKGNNVNKSALYKIVADSKEASPTSKDMFYVAIDMVYAGRSPDSTFDSCIEIMKENHTKGSKGKSASKAGYVPL